MTDALGLDGWKTTDVTIDRWTNTRIIEAEYLTHATVCPKCGVVGDPYKHGIKPSTYIDTPGWGGSVKLVARLQRYKCRHCNATFIQNPDALDDDRRMTRRCIAYIQRRCFRTTYALLSGEIGCDEKTVRTVADEHAAALSEAYKVVLPEWIGIDETKLDGKLRCIITDVANRRPVDVLIGRDKELVVSWLAKHRREGVKGIAIDMWRPYKDAARRVFPDLPVVIDRFHVVKMANYCLDRVRVRLARDESKAVRRSWMRRKSLLLKRPRNLTDMQPMDLDGWLKNEPEIAEAYALKERFFSIYEMEKDEAIKTFDAFTDEIPQHLKRDFKVLTTAMNNWRDEILAYFDYRVTNGYTEAVNGVTKVMNRMGRGYGFQALRARILFGDDPVLPHLKPFRPPPGIKGPVTTVQDLKHCADCGKVIPRPVPVEKMLLAMVMPGRDIDGKARCPECKGRHSSQFPS